MRQLREEAENARAMAEETAALRRIAERQLAEALEALQAEREAKFAAKKELDAHLSREAAYNITNLAYSIRGQCTNSFVTTKLSVRYISMVFFTYLCVTHNVNRILILSFDGKNHTIPSE